MHRLPIQATLFLLAAGLIASMAGCEKPQNAFVAPPPPEVTVATPVLQSVPEFIDQEGETEAVEQAEVRSRVKGFIQKILFQPGKEVSLGQELYQIEPDTYQAELNSANAAVDAATAGIAVANASLETAKAEVVRTEADLSRETRLLQGNAGSQSDYDRAFAANEAAKASIHGAEANIQLAIAEKRSAEATVKQAELDFGYTKVTAPIAGYITKTEVKTGNLVENGTALAEVIDRSKMFANFSLSDREILRLQKKYFDNLPADAKPEEIDWSTIKVLMRRELDEGFPYSGTLEYVDQLGVDAKTATLGLRAVFDNPDDQLLGGLFVTVRILSEEENELLLVPESAVSRDQQGPFLLTVGAENKVAETRVSVVMRIGGWAAIEGEVDESTKVIIDGLQRAIPNSVVAPQEKTLQVDGPSLIRSSMLPSTGGNGIVANETPDSVPDAGSEGVEVQAAFNPDFAS
ncbi:MAG: efflux RND transporter periplasmic adaptor subunit [Rubripirellula sp.]|nr:efflux RND transporter periplasmic adaptor subunit [Rubripirellula sp.]